MRSSHSLRDFRCYDEAEVALGEGLTVVSGPNGAGKTNLLEALYFGCTGRSCRTTNEREVVRFGAGRDAGGRAAPLAEDGAHELAVGLRAGSAEADAGRRRARRAAARRRGRPLVSVFLPDRLELIKGPPSLRRAHLDQFVSAMWPARSRHPPRLRAGAGAAQCADRPDPRRPRAAATRWPPGIAQLAEHGVALMRDRGAAVDAIAGAVRAARGRARPRGRRASRLPAAIAGDHAAELAARARRAGRRRPRAGLHRPRASSRRPRRPCTSGRELRAYGSQGQQRLALLALLLAEREAIASSA